MFRPIIYAPYNIFKESSSNPNAKFLNTYIFLTWRAYLRALKKKNSLGKTILSIWLHLSSGAVKNKYLQLLVSKLFYQFNILDLDRCDSNLIL